MPNFMVLLTGELERMKKYNIVAASFVIILIWIGVLHFTDIQDVSRLLPLLVFLDATSMAILMIGVTLFYEKQEGTLKTLLVAPIRKMEYVLAKTAAGVMSNLVTLLVLYLYARLFKEVHVHVFGLVAAVILVSLFHSLVGFLLTYYAKDFTDLLMAMMKYVFVFMLPLLLEQVGIITSTWLQNVFYILPTKASYILLQATAGGMETWEIVFSAGYLLVFSLVLAWMAVRKFLQFALKESGV
ncbi:MAG: ABC transporter permease [Bacillaceae bacterium]|nr:ABC transporter permease [Bacillaceae bacterium]